MTVTDEEYQYRIMEEQERDLARCCGFNAFEASHYTPAQMQAIAMRNMDANITAAITNAELDLDHLEAAARRNEIPDVRLTTKADLRPVYAALKAGGMDPVYAGGAGWCVMVLNADKSDVERIAKEHATLPVTLKPAGNYTAVELTAPKRYYQGSNYAR